MKSKKHKDYLASDYPFGPFEIYYVWKKGRILIGEFSSSKEMTRFCEEFLKNQYEKGHLENGKVIYRKEQERREQEEQEQEHPHSN